MSSWRHLDLTAERLPRWWAKFHSDHPGVRVSATGGALVLTSTDGSIAHFTGWLPITGITGDDDAHRQLTTSPASIGVILLRRGGYSIGLARDGQLREHKTGTRYVQSRTAAGGWSQQRFARRRDNQADDLVRTAADHAVRILAPVVGAPGPPDPAGRPSPAVSSPARPSPAGPAAGLAVGGDGFLLEKLLADPRLAGLRDLPRREFSGIPDPRFTILSEVVRRCQQVGVAVYNP